MNRVRFNPRDEGAHRWPALLALLGGMLLAAPLYAQNAVALRGQVVDEAGAVIPGAQVKLISATGRQRATITNAAGEFALANVTPGDYSDLPASLYSLIPNRCIADCQPGGSPVLLRDHLAANFPNGVTAIGPGSVSFNLSVSRTFSFGHRDNSTAQNGAAGGPQAGGGPDGPLAGGGMRSPGGGFGGRGGGFSGGGDGRFNLQLVAQITNLFNHVNYGQYSGVLSSPFFDKSSSAAGARALELGIRFNF